MTRDRDPERRDGSKVYRAVFECDKCDERWQVEMVDELGYYGPLGDDDQTKCPHCGLEGEEIE